jgi:hypothetical protein
VKLLFQRGHHAGMLHGYVDLIVERKRAIVEITGANVGPDPIDHNDLSVQLSLLVLKDPHSRFEQPFIRAVACLARNLLVLVWASGEDADVHSPARGITQRVNQGPRWGEGIVNLLNFGLSMDTWNLGWTPGSISAAALRRLPWPCR